MPRRFSAISTHNRTLLDSFEDFIQEKRALNLSSATIKSYRQTFDQFDKYYDFSNDYLLDSVDMKTIYQWIEHMKQNEIRPQSINHYLRDLRAFFNWCYENEYIETPLKIREIEYQEDMPKMYSDDEISILLEKPRAGDSFVMWRCWAIINMVYGTGLRASSVCALTIGDLDFQRGFISIPRQKNKKAGSLPLTQALANVLKEYLKAWFPKDEPDESWLFPSSASNEELVQLTVNALNHSINKYCADRGVEGHGIHSVRHNFARDMIVNGSGEFRLQAYLQHSSLQMSQHYVKLFSQDLKKDAELYNPLDQKKKKVSRTGRFKK